VALTLTPAVGGRGSRRQDATQAARPLPIEDGHELTIRSWAANTAYAVNAKATYEGIIYQCGQAHTSLVGWEPPNVPALWLNIGTDTGGDTQAPTAPSNLRVTATTASNVSWAWNASTDNVGVARYEVVQNAAVVGGDGSTTFTATNLSPRTSYTFTVRARDAAGNISSPSNQVTLKSEGKKFCTRSAAPTLASNSAAKSGGYNNFSGVMTLPINWGRFNGFVFSRGVRPVLNGLPATN
jgi:chitodextrinase